MIHARKDYNRIQDPAGLIGEDEPVFLIRGKDVAAAATVLYWAKVAAYAGADSTIVEAAINHAEAIRLWQEKNGKKIPDMPEGA